MNGQEFDFGGRRLVLAPLTLGDVERLSDRIQKMEAAPLPESSATAIDIVHASLRRNYPDMKRDEVAGLLDLSNMATAVAAALGVSIPESMRQQPGEVKAPSTGADSTPS